MKYCFAAKLDKNYIPVITYRLPHCDISHRHGGWCHLRRSLASKVFDAEPMPSYDDLGYHLRVSLSINRSHYKSLFCKFLTRLMSFLGTISCSDWVLPDCMRLGAFSVGRSSDFPLRHYQVLPIKRWKSVFITLLHSSPPRLVV